MIPPAAISYPTQERNRIVRDGRLHWFHWMALALSAALTVGAWYLTQSEYEAKIQLRFDRESERAVNLIEERMQKYEDALWAGVGAIQLNDGKVNHHEWQLFADSLALETKYPGINGIGVVLSVTAEGREAFIAEQRKTRPEFDIHPQHDQAELLPIVYIEPVGPNLSAVGLDIAHESNRYQGAIRARETGSSQITGPIVLVQDEGHTAGFLFYVPFYEGGGSRDEPVATDRFLGLVYAPFVVRKLMAGTLAAEQRYINLKIQDGDQTIFEDLNDPLAATSNNSGLSKRVEMPMYGRTWQIDINANQLFRESFYDNQSYMILIGGALLDLLLLTLFLALTRANRRALVFADAATEELRQEKVLLQRSNEELEQFAYIASHDLQEPLRMVGNFVQLLQERYKSQLDDAADTYIEFAVEGVTRMQNMLHDLLAYSRVGSTTDPYEMLEMADVIAGAKDNLRGLLEESKAKILVEDMPQVYGDKTQLIQLLQNLIANGIKFSGERALPCVSIRAQQTDKAITFEVEDNGIGISPEYYERIFILFQRLHHRDEFVGNGIGLSICKKIVHRHGGQIWVESTPGEGATFKFTLPAYGPRPGNTP